MVSRGGMDRGGRGRGAGRARGRGDFDRGGRGGSQGGATREDYGDILFGWRQLCNFYQLPDIDGDDYDGGFELRGGYRGGRGGVERGRGRGGLDCRRGRGGVDRGRGRGGFDRGRGIFRGRGGMDRGARRGGRPY